MKRLASFSVLVLAMAPATLRAQVAPAKSAVSIDRVVALVGDSTILWSEILEYVAFRLRLPTDSVDAKTTLKILNDLIDEMVLVQRASAEKIEVPESEAIAAADAKIKEVRGSQFASEQEFQRAVRAQGLGTVEEWRKRLAEQYTSATLQRRLIQKMQQDGKMIPAVVTDSEVTAIFNAKKDSLPRRPATVGFRQIVIGPKPTDAARNTARLKAESLLVEVRKSGTFEQVAKRESMDPATKDVGGDLGWNRMRDNVPEFDRVLFSLNPGDISNVVETSYGFHIIKVERVKPGEVKARHILIRAHVDSNDVVRAGLEADSVAKLWRAGTNYDTLVAHHHDSRSGEDKLIPEFPRDSLPVSYSTAIAGKQVGDIVDPFPIADPANNSTKYVVLQLTAMKEGGEYALADLRVTLRAQLMEEKSIRRLLDALRKEFYVSIRL